MPSCSEYPFVLPQTQGQTLDTMQLTQLGIQNCFPNRSTDTTPAGEQLFWGIGDSNMDGRGATIPTIASGTMWNWNGSSYDEITTQHVSNTGTTGSMYQYFAEDYLATTGYKSLIVNSGKGGSSYYPNAGGEEHWTGTGADDLYQPALTNVRAALAAKGLTQPKAIFLNCGINDETAGTSEANITTAMNTLLTNLNTSFPGVPILLLIPGRNNSNAFTQALYNLRKLSIERCEVYPDLYPIGSAAAFIEPGYVNGSDEIHYATAGLDWWGAMCNRWFINSAISNKYARGVVSGHFDELSSGRKTLVANVITGLYDRGDYFQLEHLTSHKTTVVQNTGFDWSFLGYSFRTGSTFTANTSVSSNGTSSFSSYTFFNSINTRAASQDDFIEGVKIKTKTTANGVIAVMFGGTTGTIAASFGQTAANTVYRCNDNTTSSGGEAGIVADNLYAIYRNGTTKGLKKNKTDQASTTQASLGVYNLFPRMGCNNNSGTAASFLNATYTYVFAARFTTFDYDSFFDDMEALEAGW